jgi:hypothetical protein
MCGKSYINTGRDWFLLHKLHQPKHVVMVARQNVQIHWHFFWWARCERRVVEIVKIFIFLKLGVSLVHCHIIWRTYGPYVTKIDFVSLTIQWSNIYIFLDKMCRVSARRLSIYNFAWGLLKATKKVYFVPQNWEGANNSYGGYPNKYASWTQNPKKIIGTQNPPIKTKHFLKKNCFSYLKSGKEPKRTTRRILHARPKS